MKNFFKRIFANQDINTQRQIEVDIAKAICIVGMIFVHAFEQLPMVQGSGGAGEFILLRILNTLFGATTFMFCMGFGMSYTKKNSPKNLIIRGAIIFSLGILLNFLRTVVAELIINNIHPGTFSNNFLLATY